MASHIFFQNNIYLKIDLQLGADALSLEKWYMQDKLNIQQLLQSWPWNNGLDQYLGPKSQIQCQ